MKFSCKVRTVNRSEKMEQKGVDMLNCMPTLHRDVVLIWNESTAALTHRIGAFPSLVYMHLRSQGYRIRCLAT